MIAVLGFNMVVPFISKIATAPDVFCHKMSALPSPLKSPVPLIDHWPGMLATNELFWFNMGAPFISQMGTLPEVSRHRQCPMPSPLKSPVPGMLQLVGTLATDGLFTDTVVPFIIQIAT